MPEFNIKVDGDRMTDVTLHSKERVPFPVPGAKLPGGKTLDRPSGDYVVLCITQFGEAGKTVNCTVSGANDSKRETSGEISGNVGGLGKLTLTCDFRLTLDGEVL
jgi:hypothetical protein